MVQFACTICSWLLKLPLFHKIASVRILSILLTFLFVSSFIFILVLIKLVHIIINFHYKYVRFRGGNILSILYFI